MEVGYQPNLKRRLRGSGASGDFGPEQARWRTEDRQAAKHKCLISSRFPSLTRVTGEHLRPITASCPQMHQDRFPLPHVKNSLTANALDGCLRSIIYGQFAPPTGTPILGATNRPPFSTTADSAADDVRRFKGRSRKSIDGVDINMPVAWGGRQHRRDS